VFLALLGGAAGLAIAFAGTRLILHFAFPVIDGRAGIPIGASPSLPVLLFAFGVSFATGMAFGIAPAWMATRVDPIEALRGTGRSSVRVGSLPRKTLVVLQAALSLVLLSASGLLTAALHSLENQPLGFDPDRRIVASIEPRLAGYRPEQLTLLYRRIHDALSGIPGVSDVALTTFSPQTGNQWGGSVWIDGQPAPGPRAHNQAAWSRVTPGYLDAVGNPIVKGRGISQEDIAASRNVAVINEAFARKFFPQENPLGKHFGRFGMEAPRQYEIVGVAKDIRNLTYDLDKPTDPFFFLPEAQHDILPGASAEVSPGSHFLHDIVIVTRPGVSLSIAKVRQAMASVDPNLPVISLRTVSEQVAAQFGQQRLIARLSSFFGILSLVLASIGMYGVTAYNAGRRVNEVGVRMALGANRGDVVRLVLRGAFGLILFGLLIGLPLTLAVGKLLGHQLYGMSPYNPVVMLAAVLALVASALVASFIPAVRASSISPVEALRAE
jgi:predicted permease